MTSPLISQPGEWTQINSTLTCVSYISTFITQRGQSIDTKSIPKGQNRKENLQYPLPSELCGTPNLRLSVGHVRYCTS